MIADRIDAAVDGLAGRATVRIGNTIATDIEVVKYEDGSYRIPLQVFNYRPLKDGLTKLSGK